MYYADNHCHYEEKLNPHVYVFTGRCLITVKPYTVTVPAEGLYQYRQGVHIQKALPDLSAEDREFLMTGLSPEGWDLMFKE